MPGNLEMWQLRPYQRQIATAVLESVFGKKGLTFSVEIARQGGKNEVSAQLELLLLTLNLNLPHNLIKCSPTFQPQAAVSMTRLADRLNDAGFHGIWRGERGYIIRLGSARAIFLSAEESANVVGNTAHLLMEIDESQDVSKEKYTKDFKPMGSTTNCTVVHYGTTWDETTLLEEVKQNNLELEQRDGIQRHFRYDWQEVSKYNPEYLAYVEAERQRLGDNHPLFLTQYCLLPLTGNNSFLNLQQRAQLQGKHARCHEGEPGKIYIAGVDLAGEAEDTVNPLKTTKPRQDATVMTIGEMDFTNMNAIQKQPGIKIVEHYAWTGVKHTDLYPKLVDLLRDVWNCKRVVVDATGIGQPIAAFLRQALGSKVTPFVFTGASKSKLGFELLAAVNAGRLKMYAGDGSPEYREFWQEIELAKSEYRP
ncbi:MAG: hypothetical protein PHE50_06230, partial [Dehalococcoidales bacterium]|nr:hypothetical protein [Dehalococcoidales bacterium]